MEDNETTLVEDHSVVETKEEMTIVEDTAVSQEETHEVENSGMESSHQKELSMEDKTAHESSRMDSSQKEEHGEVTQSKEEKTDHDSSRMESSHKEEHTEVKSEHESSHVESSHKEEIHSGEEKTECDTKPNETASESIGKGKDDELQEQEDGEVKEHKDDNVDHVNTDLNTGKYMADIRCWTAFGPKLTVLLYPTNAIY